MKIKTKRTGLENDKFDWILERPVTKDWRIDREPFEFLNNHNSE